MLTTESDLDDLTRRFVFAVVGSLGDLFPTMAVALSLRRRGASVLMLGPPDYSALVRSCGLTFSAVGAPVRSGFRNSTIPRPPEGFRGLIREIDRVVFGGELRRSALEIRELLDPGDIVIAHPLQVAASLVAQGRGLPCVTASPLTLFVRNDARLPLNYPCASLGGTANRFAWLFAEALAERRYGDEVWRLCADLGVHPGPSQNVGSLFQSPQLSLLFTSPALLATRSEQLSSAVRVTGAIRWESPRLWRHRKEIEHFLSRGPAPLVFTGGRYLTPGLADTLELAEVVSRKVGMRAVVIDSQASSTGEVKPGIFQTRFVPLSFLADHSAAAVHHGGHGTAIAFAAAGKPAVIVPRAFDQHDENVNPDWPHRARLIWPHLCGVRYLFFDRVVFVVRSL